METPDDTLRSEELLAQLGWIRALARSLVFDPDLTDEVLQDVCLLALQRAPPGARTGPRLRAWLATATRLLARRSGRADRRRLRREQAAARAEAVPSASEASEQREALRLLVEAVTGLDEPYFSSVVERYFDGRSMAEIAARHGTTAAAIRQRLARARGRLRSRLEPLLDDRRVCRLLGVLPAAGLAGSLGRTRALDVADRGGILVTQQAGTRGVLKLAALLLVGVGLFIAVWRGLREPDRPTAAPDALVRTDAGVERPLLPETRLPQPLMEDAASLIADPGESAPANAAPADAPSSASLADSQLFRVVVVDGSARPVPDALVETLVQTGRTQAKNPALSRRIRETVERSLTDALGRCTVRLAPHPGDGILITRDGVGCSGILSFQHLTRARHADGETVIALSPPVEVHGQVVRADGAVVPGCTVVAHNSGGSMEYGEPREAPVMTTDAEGRFQGTIDFSPYYAFFAVDRDGASTGQTVSREEPGESIELTLRLPGDWSIGGVVLDEAGAAVAGASVLALRVPDDAGDAAVGALLAAMSLGDRAAGKSGADGSFALDITQGGPWVVTALVGGRPAAPPARVIMGAARSRAEVTLQLEAPAAISGVVVDAAGHAVPDVLVSLQAVPPALLNGTTFLMACVTTTASTRADTEGRFRFASLPPHGSFDVRACPSLPEQSGPGRIPTAPCETPWIRTAAGNDALVLTADFGASTRGSVQARVVSRATGQPVAKVRWTLALEGESRIFKRAFMHELASDDGSLVIHDLDPQARYTLAVAAEGLAFVDVHDIMATETGTIVPVELPQVASLQVEVADEHGAVVPYARVEVHRKVEYDRGVLGGDRDAQAADARGQAIFTELDPGEHRVTVTAGGASIERTALVGDGAREVLRVIVPGSP